MTNNFEYKKNEDGIFGYTITKYIGEDADVTIPKTINGLPVQAIGYRAFFECKTLTTITIPDSIVSIVDSAIVDCDQLICINVELDNPFYSSKDGVLFNKDRTVLIKYPDNKPETNYVIPNSVISVSEVAFYKCNNLINITLSTKTKTIEQYAFGSCEKLCHIIIPNSVITIGQWAFSCLPNLKNLVLGQNIAKIGQWAFMGCPKITAVTIPASVISLGYGVFYDCSKLHDINIASKTTTIGVSAFSGCANHNFENERLEYKKNEDGTGIIITRYIGLEPEIIIPDVLQSLPVTTIATQAFLNNIFVVNVTLSKNTMSIGSLAFYGCTSLQTVIIPDSVLSIGDFAFMACPSLIDIELPKTATLGRDVFSSKPTFRKQA